MKNLAFALCAVSLLFAAPTFAQAQDAALGAGAPADQGGGGGDAGEAGGGKGGKMKEMIKACRTEAKGKGLKGAEMKSAMMDCVSKQSPKAAGILKCRMEAKDKGMKPGSDDMKAYVKDCKKKAG